MCGIVGFNFSNKDLLDRMKDSLHHRGPDDKGSFIDDGISLGHVRLSILDLSKAGHQPMEFDDLVLVYNGEVYNFKEIRKELIALGYDFDSDSDSEVVLKAYHKWGKKAVDRFRGMFAFCIYERKNRKLILFRDRVGVKPLYYYFDGKEFIFASEIRAIREIKKLKIDRSALVDFFEYGYISKDNSIFEDVSKLLPACYLEFDLDSRSIEISKYWKVENFFNTDYSKTEEQIITELDEVLIESFKYRMVSDAPVGVFLSGGVDSSLVASVLQKHYGEINTFTIGFDESKYDESVYAKNVANFIGSNHTERILKVTEAREILKSFATIYDEPFGDSSGIPSFLVSRIAKENGVKVVLSADGGDEIFCGYERYWVAKNLGSKFNKIPLGNSISKLIDISTPFLTKIPIKNMEHKVGFVSNLLKASSWQEIYENMIKNYRDDVNNLLDIESKFKENSYFGFGEKLDVMQGMMLWDFYNYLPNDILVKMDRATMANSIEGREPFLDHKIIEYASTIPFEYKYRDKQSKYILKKVLEKYLPKEMIYRKKMGFGIPMLEWFRDDLISLFDEYFAEDDDIVNMQYVRELLYSFKSGAYINVNKLWFVLVYKMWKRAYL